MLVVYNLTRFDINELNFDCKYGEDGAQSGSNYAHHFQEEGRSDSINFTRPVFVVYEKESPKLIRNIIESINKSLLRSDIFEINLNNTFYKFKLNINGP